MSSAPVKLPYILRYDQFPSMPLWRTFDSIFYFFNGEFAEEHQFIEGKTPMSTFKETSLVLAIYYLSIFLGREFMRHREPVKLNALFKIHNLFLTILSGGLLALFAEQIVPSLFRAGLYDSICGASGWTAPLVKLYYWNYITKYIELVDTLFLVVRKKPLTFLHTYHHGATALLCYTQLVGHTPVSWVPITLNLLVHVVMYWYYFQAARGVKVSWKQWITRLQIAQFVIDLGFVYFATYDYTASTYLPQLPHVGTCRGEEFAAFAGCAILTSYLVLFLSFYAATYKRAGANNDARAKAVANGQSEKEIADAAAKDLKTKEIPNPSKAASEMVKGMTETAQGVKRDAIKATS